MGKDKYRDFVNSQEWIFSKTFEKWAPHEYILRNNIKGTDDEFVSFVQYIRDNGTPIYFGNRIHTYLELDEKYYWTMGDPIEETIVLNRCNMHDYKMIYVRYKK